MATARLLPIPQTDTLYVSEIGDTDLPSKNDAEIRVIFGANVTGLTIDAFSVSGVDSNGDAVTVKVVETSLEGQNSVYAIKIRPPETDNGTLTLTLAADAVHRGQLRNAGVVDPQLHGWRTKKPTGICCLKRL